MTLDAIKVAMITAFEKKEKRKMLVSNLLRAAFTREGDGALVVRHGNRNTAAAIKKYDFELRDELQKMGESVELVVKWDPRLGTGSIDVKDARDALVMYFEEKGSDIASILQDAGCNTSGSRYSVGQQALLFYIKDDSARERLLGQMPAIRAALREMKSDDIAVKVFALPLQEAFCAVLERFREGNPSICALLEDVVSVWGRDESGEIYATPLFDETKAGLLEHKAEIEAAMSEASKRDVALIVNNAFYDEKRLKSKKKESGLKGTLVSLTEDQLKRVEEKKSEAQKKMLPQMPADKRLTELAEQLRGFADQLVAAAEGQGLENLKNVLVPKTGVDTIDVFSEGWDAEDCIHLHACRRLAAIAKKNGERFARGCNSKCSAYEAGE